MDDEIVGCQNDCTVESVLRRMERHMEIAIDRWSLIADYFHAAISNLNSQYIYIVLCGR